MNQSFCVTILWNIGVAMSPSQSPREILMVRPCNFMFNQETAVTNHYQVRLKVSLIHFREILYLIRMKIQKAQTSTGDRKLWKNSTPLWKLWGGTLSRWQCSRWWWFLILLKTLYITHLGHALPREAWRRVPQQLDLGPPHRRGRPLPHGHAKQEAGAETGPHPVAQGQLRGS